MNPHLVLDAIKEENALDAKVSESTRVLIAQLFQHNPVPQYDYNNEGVKLYFDMDGSEVMISVSPKR